MSASAEKLTHEVLALPEEERRDIFLRLAQSLPSDVSHLAESSRRAEELRSGKVAPMSEATFQLKLNQLRSSFQSA
jgi:hypothetical protein